MDKLKHIFSELASSLNSKIYLVNHFDDIRNRIDLECQSFLNRDVKEAENLRKATEQQHGLVTEVDLFEKKCLHNLEKNPYDQLDLDEFDRRLKSLDSSDQKAVLELEKDIYSELYSRKKLLFMNKGIFFLNKNNLDKFSQFEEKESDMENSDILFGSLFLIEDEFFIFSEKFRKKIDEILMDDDSDDSMDDDTDDSMDDDTDDSEDEDTDNSIDEDPGNLINEDIINNDIQQDWLNEYLRIQLIIDYIVDLDIDLVNYVSLNLKKRERIAFDTFSKALLKNWLLDLPSLRFIELGHCNIKELDSTLFQNAPNLEELDMGNNQIQQLDSNLFYYNTNLRRLNLALNEIKVIHSDCFKKLSKLTEMYLSENQISVIPTELFQDLGSLEILILHSNQISFGDQSHHHSNFKGLHKLKKLHLFKNNISFIPLGFFQYLNCLDFLDLENNYIRVIAEGLFQELHNLEHLNLSENKISFLDHNGHKQGPDIFKGLGKLVKLDLGNNQIGTNMHERLFQNLTSLKTLELNANQIKCIPEKLFQDIGRLESLNLCGNHMSVMPQDIFQNFVNLKELNLRHNYIEKIPDGLFRKLFSLRILNLYDNEIKSISERSFQDLSNLKELRLGHNKVSEFVYLDNSKLTSINENDILTANRVIFKGLISLSKLELEDNPIYRRPERPNRVFARKRFHPFTYRRDREWYHESRNHYH